MSCAFALICKKIPHDCKTGNELSMLNVLRKYEVYIQKCHHILDMLPDILVIGKEPICVIKFL